MRGGKRGGEDRDEKGEKAFLVMWPRRLSALNPPLTTYSVYCALAVDFDVESCLTFDVTTGACFCYMFVCCQ